MAEYKLAEKNDFLIITWMRYNLLLL